MPSIPCPNVITCPGAQGGAANVLDADSPIGNFSSELPDDILFTATGFPIWNPDNPVNIDGPGDPSFPPLYFAEGCVGVALSSLSQDDANALAQRQAIQCEYNKQKPTPGLFFNAAQQCSFTCPDGSLYTFTVEPGFVVAGSQSLADTIANTIACERAAADYICFGTLSPASACVGTQYSGTVMLLSKNPPITVTVGIGALPPGLVMSQSLDSKTLTISGTPTTPGNFSFSLHGVDPQGNTHDKMFTIEVLGITNIASLPQPTINRPYSAQLTALGGTSPFTFGTITGLPTGLALSPTGTISGTPSVHYTGKFSVTFQVTDTATGLSCAQVWNSQTNEPPGPDWTTLTWQTYQLNQGVPANFVAGQGSGPNAFAGLTLNSNLANVSISPVLTGGVAYTGPMVNCEMLVIVTQWDPSALATFRPIHSVTGQLAVGGGPIVGPGIYNLTFTIPASVGATIHFDDASPGNFWAFLPANMYLGTALKVNFTWQVFNL